MRRPRLAALSIAIIWVLVSATAASAHDHGAGSWINRQQLRDPLTKHYCCNAVDCQRVPDGGLKEISGGYHITETGEHWPYGRVLWKSQDGAWWRCAYGTQSPFPGIVSRPLTTRCLIGPPPSF